ncbi:hypothetical protein [Maribacter sp. IgM3_T14_3]|uniref:hypothetical protein n=1 Tax=Maribacter sp. IgM3_T14_3 TaxID=3415140 RepID=UPI003C6F9531
MKKITFLSFLFCLVCEIALAQTEGISYQAVLVDNNPDEIPGIDVPSNNIPNQELNVRFTILNSFGDTDYQETQNTQTDDYGVINLMIGEGIPTGQGFGSFNLINWDGPKTLEVAIDLEGGNNFSPFSSQSLSYVPYVRHRNLIADGITDLNNGLNVNNQRTAWFTGDVNVEQDTRLQQLQVQGQSEFQDRMVIETTMTDTNQERLGAYPLLLTGSSHGMAIQLNENTPGRKDNFMSFWNANDEPIGRIEGFQPNQASFDFASISAILLGFEPTEDDEPEEGDEEEDIDRNDYPTDFPDALDTYFNNDYSLNFLIQATDIVNSTFQLLWNGACFGTWLPGVDADCDDFVWSLYDVFIQGTQLALYLGYNELNKGVAFESGGADYAEWLQKNDENEPLSFGDVVGVKGGVISKSFIDADHYMVVSKSPIVSGAMPKDEQKKYYKQIAFLGQVPVKVIGEVSKGDYILPSGNGDGMAIAVAVEEMKINDYQRIIGVSWTDYNGNELYSYVNTAVGINSNDLTQQVTAMQVVINQMQTALVQVNPNYQPNFFDVNGVKISNIHGITKAPTMKQTIASKYGLKEDATAQEAINMVNTLMKEHDLNSNLFNFSDLPYLTEVLQNPTEENLAKARNAYANAQKNIESLSRQLN